jgi:hypothetical protein
MNNFNQDKWLRHIWGFKGTVVEENKDTVVIKDAPDGTYKELCVLQKRYRFGIGSDTNPIHMWAGEAPYLIQKKLQEVTPEEFGYEYHPAANLFPMLTGKHLNDLAADIKANGLQVPIVH